MKVIEHRSEKYGPRTYTNAKRADLTIAFALDFSSAGEKLTKKAAGDAYISIGLERDKTMAAREIWKACRALGKGDEPLVLNIAGNGIYTLLRKSKTIDQFILNKWVYDVLYLVCGHWPVKLIVSGGQTGVDLAGGVAAEVLGIPCEMTFPKGFKQRHENGVDAEHTEVDILSAVAYYAGVLSRDIYGDDVPQ